MDTLPRVQELPDPFTDRANEELFSYRPFSAEQRERFERDGYFLYGNVLSDAALEVIRAECDYAWKIDTRDHVVAENKPWRQTAHTFFVHRIAPVTRRFYFHGPLVDVAAAVIGPNVKACASVITFKMKGNNKTYRWHQDNGYGELSPGTAISNIIALDDADEENGCLWMLPGSHKGGLLEAGRVGYEQKMSLLDHDLEVDESKAVPIRMKAGDCLSIHGLTLHKSNPNVSNRDRRFLFVRYADADAVEVYNNGTPRLGRILRGQSKFPEINEFEQHYR